MDGEERIVNGNGDEPLELEVLEEPRDGGEELLLASTEFAQWSAAPARRPRALPLPRREPQDPLREPQLRRALRHPAAPARALVHAVLRAVLRRGAQRGAVPGRAVRRGRPPVDRLDRAHGRRPAARHVYKVWILPLRPARWLASRAPSRPICLDITAEYRSLVQGTFTSLLEAALRKDNDTGHHIERVNRYARELAERPPRPRRVARGEPAVHREHLPGRRPPRRGQDRDPRRHPEQGRHRSSRGSGRS